MASSTRQQCSPNSTSFRRRICFLLFFLFALNPPHSCDGYSHSFSSIKHRPSSSSPSPTRLSSSTTPSTSVSTSASSSNYNYRTLRGDGAIAGGGSPMPSKPLRPLKRHLEIEESLRKELLSSPKYNPLMPTASQPTKSDDQSQQLRKPSISSPMPKGRPSFHKVPAPSSDPSSKFQEIKSNLKDLNLHTVCEEASCPNIGECWSSGTGTIMLLGDTCTRGCLFCNVKTSSKPPPPDVFEPFKTTEAVLKWGVDYIVLTSVDRDDIEDGGSSHFAETVRLLKERSAKKVQTENTGEVIKVEVLASDFAGDLDSVSILANSGLDVYAHNIETVERLQSYVRDRRASYWQSLSTLKHAKTVKPGLITKTSVMLGLGETDNEVIQTMRDLRSIDCDVITFGQYLRPSTKHLAVVEYVPEVKFMYFKQVAEEMGFMWCASGAMVRSSYKAGEFFREGTAKLKKRDGV